jgi:HEPN domain-containing protein
MKQITKEWLKAAEDDIIAMKAMIGNELITNISSFHAQQCIEKSFKAVIEEFDLGYQKIHQLVHNFYAFVVLYPFEVKDTYPLR